jgi:hypothetical protein
LRKAIAQRHSKTTVFIKSGFAGPTAYDMKGDILHLVGLEFAVVKRP